MKALLDSGYRDCLGPGEDVLVAYWAEILRDLGLQHPASYHAGSSIPVQIHGDEGQVNNLQHMIISWQPELSPYKTNSLASRFLFAVIPERIYWVEEGAPWLLFYCH